MPPDPIQHEHADARIALFGGSFNPIHEGHLGIARAVAHSVGFDRVVFLPTKSPPHKSAGSLLDAEHRLAMVRLATARDPAFSVSDYDLTRGGPTYTIDTIDHFRGEWGDQREIGWIIGADSLAELHTWHRVAKLVDGCRLLTAARPGSESIDWGPLSALLSAAQVKKLQESMVATPLFDISATAIRRRAGAGESLSGMVPKEVAGYIEKHGLYRTG